MKILIPIHDKVTGESKTIQIRQDEYGYCLFISRDQYSAGWLEIRVFSDCLFVEAYHPGADMPEVIRIGNTLVQGETLEAGFQKGEI